MSPGRFEVKSFLLLPIYPLCFMLEVQDVSSHFSPLFPPCLLCCCSTMMDSYPSGTVRINQPFFLSIALVMVFPHSDREVNDTQCM